jgi:hypothetical protein
MAITSNGVQADGIATAVIELKNKTINLTNNTVTGTTAQFNTALSDDNFATLAGSEVLTNKNINATNNTITNIANSSLINPYVTINGAAVALGSSVSISSGATLPDMLMLIGG